MDRREALKSLMAMGLGAVSMAGCAQLKGRTLGTMASKKKQPNVVFVFSDQQRWDTMGCYGQPMDITPNLDQMAKEGVKFEHAFSCQPVCGPARASIQTGKYAEEIGCYRNGIALPMDEKTIANYLSEAGYEVGYIGKWHLASTVGANIDEPVDYRVKAIPPERRGGYKDYWLASDILEFTSKGYNGHMFDKDMNKVEFEGYRVDCLTDFALDYLETRDGEKPFFLFLSYIEPHHQNDEKRYIGPDGSKEKYKDFVVPGDLEGTEGDWRESYPDYLGCINSIDKNLGRIREKLDELGLAEDTVIIYTGDHGSHFRTRNREYKRSCHESSIHVPMIAYGSGFPEGVTVEEMVSLIDVAPTVLAAAGIPTPADMKGRPLQDVANGRDKNWPEEAFVQISETQVGRAIRTKKWKYSVKAPGKRGGWDPRSDMYMEQFLYDLDNDPHERNNLVSDPDYQKVREEMAERLKKRMAQAGEKVPEIVPAAWPEE